jgi:hypothetical protein
MNKQTKITSKMRQILIDWIFQFQVRYSLKEETSFLTVNLIDRFLSQTLVDKQQFKLLVASALFVSTKYTELFPLRDLKQRTGFTKEQILDMESLLLNTLNFNITSITVIPFLEIYLNKVKEDEEITKLSYFFAEISMLEIRLLQYLPSQIAFSSILIAMNLLEEKEETEKLLKNEKYCIDDLSNCIALIKLTYMDSKENNFETIHKKYSLDSVNFEFNS